VEILLLILKKLTETVADRANLYHRSASGQPISSWRFLLFVGASCCLAGQNSFKLFIGPTGLCATQIFANLPTLDKLRNFFLPRAEMLIVV
jgi:hypothetical protein